MREFNCLNAIPSSFYSKKLYRDVANQWGFGVVLYLLLVITLGWVLSMFQVQNVISMNTNSFVMQFIPQIPMMTVKDGNVQTPENHAYMIKDKNNKTFAIIDVTGAHQSLENSDAIILITKDKIFFKKSDEETRVIDLDKKTNATINPPAVGKFMVKSSGYSWIVILPFVIFLSFGYRVVEAVIYAIIGKIFALIQGVSLTYGQIYKMSFFAMTPAIVVATLATILQWEIPHALLVYFLISMVYLIFATRANK